MSHEKKRIAIYGGTKLSAAESRFVESLAYTLLTTLEVVIVTGGFLYSPQNMPGAISTDFSVLQGVIKFAAEKNIPLEDILETWLPDPGVESDLQKKDVIRFREGVVKKMTGESAQARRFSMTKDVDILVTVKGQKHTSIVLDFAITINKPAFPLAFTGGDSKVFWNIHKDRVKNWFNLPLDFMHQLDIEDMEISWSPVTKNEVLEKLIAAINYGLNKEALNNEQYKKVQEELKAGITRLGDTTTGANNDKKKQVRLFLSYAREDEQLKDELDTSLIALKRDERISVWQDKNIKPGEEWDKRTREELQNADIILLLLSADFLASDYIWDTALKFALQRHEEGKTKVIPIYIRSVADSNMPYKKLDGYFSPENPIASFEGHKRDEAYKQIVEGINREINEWLNKKDH